MDIYLTLFALLQLENFFMKRFYSTDIENQKRYFYAGLPERKRREYAVIEANKLGHGGSTVVVR